VIEVSGARHLPAATVWQVPQGMGEEISVLPTRCAWCAPTPSAEGLVLPARVARRRTDCALPWQEEQVGVPPAGTTKAWALLAGNARLPSREIVAVAMLATSEVPAVGRHQVLVELGIVRIEDSTLVDAERNNESRPSTTHALVWSNAEPTGLCVASLSCGSIVRRSSESDFPATATGALVGPSASR